MTTEADYTETQWFPWWANLGLLVPAAVALGAGFLRSGSKPVPLPLAAALFALLIFTWLLLMRMTIRVDGTHVRIRFGFLGWIRFAIALADVGSAKAVTYRPFADFGGWGIRFSTRGRRAYSTHGNRAVLLEVRGKEIYVGTDAPEALAAAIESRRAGR